MSLSVGLTHVAMSVPEGTLTDEYRTRLLEFYGRLLGWSEMEDLRQPDRLSLWVGRSYINIRERPDPMVTHGYEHFGVLVASADGLRELWAQLDAEDDDVEPRARSRRATGADRGSASDISCRWRWKCSSSRTWSDADGCRSPRKARGSTRSRSSSGPAYLRNAFTKGTEQEVDFLVDALGLEPGMRVLDVGCGPGRHSLALARRGIDGRTASTTRRTSSRSPARRAAAEDLPATFEVLDVRDLGVRRRVRRRDLPLPGRVRAARRATTRRTCSAGSADAVRPGRAARGQRVLGRLRGPLPRGRRGRSIPRTGVLHERRDGPERGGRGAARSTSGPPASPPASSSLLARGAGLDVDRDPRGHARGVRDPARRRSTIPSSCCSHGGPKPGSLIRLPFRSSPSTRSPIPSDRAPPDRHPCPGDLPLVRAASRPRSAADAPETGAVATETAPGAPPTATRTPTAAGRERRRDRRRRRRRHGGPRRRRRHERRRLRRPRRHVVRPTRSTPRIVEFDDGDIVTGTVVKIDTDEVLLDIGFKSEGVIPSKELSIRNDVDPHEVVSLDEELEALVLQKEDKDGRLILSKKRAQYERAWGTIEEIKEEGRRRQRPGHRGRQGRPHPRHRPARLPARVARRPAPRPRPAAVRRPRDRVQDHRARQEPQQRRALAPRVPRRDPARAARRVPHQPQAGRGPPGCRVVGRQLRCVRRPRRHGRTRPRVRAVVEARRPPELGRAGRRRGHRAGARRRPLPRAHLALAQGHPAGPVAGVRRPATRSASSSTAGSPSSCRSVRSCRSAKASRVWCTSPRWPCTTSRRPSRSSPRARSSG